MSSRRNDWLAQRVRKIAERTGYSEDEVMENLINHLDLITSESDLA
jgi:hypothetical protein